MGLTYDHSSTYRDKKLRNIPHFLRLKNIECLIRENKCGNISRYADFGCSDGFLTDRIGKILEANQIFGFDYNRENIEYGSTQYHDVTFSYIDLNESDSVGDKFDFITCFETLEHVSDPKITIHKIINALNDNGTAVVTVPIEIGIIGIFKLIIKTTIYRDSMDELQGGRAIFWKYLWALLKGRRISSFRNKRPGWSSHFGFDYRDVDEALRNEGIVFRANNRGFTRFYLFHKT